MLIALCGYKGSGKTTITDLAIRRMSYGYYRRIGFADPMVDMIEAMGIPRSILNDKSRWNEPQSILCGRSIRHAVDTLGTDWGRDQIGINVWTGIALQRAVAIAGDGKTVIIDNVRFPSEVEAVKSAGGLLIAFRRYGQQPCAEDLQKPSERHIAAIQREQCDYEFLNVGSLRQAARDFRATILAVDQGTIARRARITRLALADFSFSRSAWPEKPPVG